MLLMNLHGLKFKIEKKDENCTILIPKGNSFYRNKSSSRGPQFKVSSEGLSTEMYILIQSPIKIIIGANVA